MFTAGGGGPTVSPPSPCGHPHPTPVAVPDLVPFGPAVLKEMRNEQTHGYDLVQSSLSSAALYFFPLPMSCESKSMGSGKIIVEFFSAEIEFSVWKNKNKNNFVSILVTTTEWINEI